MVPVILSLTSDAEPFRCNPYLSHPTQTAERVRKEVYQQCGIDALRQLSAEEIKGRDYTSSVFGVAKKDGTLMRLVFDLRKLNAILQRKEHYLLTIDELISGVGVFVFASVLGRNVGYLSIQLDETARMMPPIVLLF